MRSMVKKNRSLFKARMATALRQAEVSLTDVMEGLGASWEVLHEEPHRLTVEQLLHLAEVLDKPIDWFFGQQAVGMSVESAQAGLTNVAKMRLYLDSLEQEFRKVQMSCSAEDILLESSEISLEGVEIPQDNVVDFASYLDRARQILERESGVFHAASSESGQGAMSQDSIEMMAQALYSAEHPAVAPKSHP